MDDLFFQHFSLTIAHTPEHFREIHRLRYQVYCREFGFEREEDCPGGLERDGYDDRSVHCLLVHQASRVTAGCVRVILSVDGLPEAGFPFEQVYEPDPALPAVRLDRAQRLTVGEISRLTVLAPFRQNTGAAGAGQPTALASLSLALAAASLGIDLGLHASYTMMEPRLARLLQRFGFDFQQVGRLVEYHGQRAPYAISPGGVRPLFDPRHPAFALGREVRRRLRQQVRANPPGVLVARADEGTLLPSAAFPDARIALPEAA